MKTNSTVLQSIIDSVDAGIWVVDRDLQVEWINTRVVSYTNVKHSSKVKGKHCYSEILGNEGVCDGCPSLRTFQTRKSEYLEFKREYEGELRYYRVTATPLRKKGQIDFSHVIEMIQDVTVQKNAEDDLRRLNSFNEAIIENAPVAIFTVDRNGCFTSVNPALASLSGLGPMAEEKLIGFNWLTNPYTIKCGLADPIRRGLMGESFQLWDFPFLTYRGDRSQYINFKGVPLKRKDGVVEGLLCIIEETTDSVRARAQLMQEAKMSAIGRLAAGVAHELNNPLATLAAHSELAQDLLKTMLSTFDSDDMRELCDYFEVIQEQTFRCKRIIKDLLDLTRKEGFERAEVDVNGLLEDVLRLIDFRKLGISIGTHPEGNLPHVLADSSALRQVLLNVITNAIDAVEGRARAAILFRTFADDRSVKVECEDNGMGIPDAIADKIFEPFFTTKEPKKGMGLGLALCYELLGKMGGAIEAESKPGRGSTFRITLPIAE
jgi:two-component system, NtrC family, sensor kinase